MYSRRARLDLVYSLSSLNYTAILKMHTEYEKRLFSHLHQYYKGSARVPLAAIKPSPKLRAVDEKNVTRLAKIFLTEGCFRNDKKNFAQVLVDPNQLEMVQLQDITYDEQTTVMFPPKSLECLHGWHRLLAARCLPFDEHWWPVDIYIRLPSGFPSLITL